MTERIEQLVNQRATIANLTRDSLTVRALEVEALATSKDKFSAGVSALRLAADYEDYSADCTPNVPGFSRAHNRSKRNVRRFYALRDKLILQGRAERRNDGSYCCPE